MHMRVSYDRHPVMILSFERPDGPSYLSHSALCRRDAAGNWCGYRGIARDIGSRVQAEQRRRSAAAMLAELSAQVPGMIFQARLDGQRHLSLPYVSDRIADIFELTAADVNVDAAPAVGRIHTQDADRVLQSMQRSAADLGIWQQTFRVVLPARGERVLAGHARPKRLPDGSAVWHGLLTDVTATGVATRKIHWDPDGELRLGTPT